MTRLSTKSGPARCSTFCRRSLPIGIASRPRLFKRRASVGFGTTAIFDRDLCSCGRSRRARCDFAATSVQTLSGPFSSFCLPGESVTMISEKASKPIRRVVLVDDDSTDNFLHKRVLTRSGLVEDVVAFEQPEAALEYLATLDHPVDLICLDINMPRMNGFEFLEAYQTLEIASSLPPIVVILSTSISTEALTSEKQANSVIASETKPLRQETIEKLVSQYFSGDSVGNPTGNSATGEPDSEPGTKP